MLDSQLNFLQENDTEIVRTIFGLRAVCNKTFFIGPKNVDLPTIFNLLDDVFSRTLPVFLENQLNF